MKHRRKFLRAAFMATCAVISPHFAAAQADAWITGNEWTRMDGGPAGVAVSLPTPGGAFTYTGLPARYSQHARTNGSGQLIFFEVDGNLYDGDGYLIADARTAVNGSTTCQECLAYGVMEFISVPAPGSCGLYYLFGAVPLSQEFPFSHIQVALLDMNLDNPRFPGQGGNPSVRKGRLIGLVDFEVQSLYPQFASWDYGVGYVQEPEFYDNDLILRTSDFVAKLPIDPNGKSQSPLLRCVQGQTPNSPSWLFAIMTTKTFVYKITANGISPVDPLPGLAYIPTDNDDPLTHKAYYRDADVRFTSTGAIRLVQTDGYGLHVYPDDAQDNNLLTTDLDPSTGAVLPAGGGYAIHGYRIFDCLSVPNGSTGLAGCALRPDANGVYVVGDLSVDCISSAPTFGHLDLITGDFTNLNASVPSVAAYTHSRFYRNLAPGGTDEAIYVPHSGGVDAITGIASPSSISAVPSALIGAIPPQHDEPPGSNTGNLQPYFLDPALQGDQHLSPGNIATCCSYFQMAAGAVVGGHTQMPGMQSSWTPTNNPLQPGSSTLVFNADVVVETGAHLILNNLTLKFTNGAKVIVKRGGVLNAYGSTFTSSACPGERWPGIRVEGTANDGNQFSAAQGSLQLNNSTVENASVGVWCAREVNGQTVTGYFGGRILGVNSTFRNCNVGVRIERYHRTSDAPNFCQFNTCTFKTDNAWPDLGSTTPQYHAHLYDVNGVKFRQCTFLNDSPGQFALLNRGWGVFGLFAGFDILGNTVQDASLFKNLTIGVAAATGTLRKANIRQSWFRDNLIGAYMQACTAPEISRSTFYVPDANSPNTPMGLVLHQSTGYTVEENTFNGGTGFGMNIGIYFLGDVRAENRIYNNNFNGLAAGTYVLGRQKGGIGSPEQTEYVGLQLLCSDYTGCGRDYYLGDNTYIKPTQGRWGWGGLDDPLTQLAGNRFFSAVFSSGISFSPVQPDCITEAPIAPFFDYTRHDVPECDPLNPDCHYSDSPVEAGEFDKATACGQGTLPAIGGGGGVIGFELAAAELQSAQSYFTGTVDAGDREDIIKAIEDESPWMPSYSLRDYLLARCPLSDQALLTVISRGQPMDPWHLTQVMLANAKLTEQVMKALEYSGLLNTYMLAIVQQAGSGPTVKDLLRDEVELRASEKARYFAIAVDELARDTTLPDPPDTLRALITAHADPSDYYLLAMIAMELGDHASAIGWMDALVAAKAEDPVLLRDLVSMDQTLGGEWENADASQRAALATMAGSSEPGAALAWAILYQLGETIEVPIADMPKMEKSLRLWPARAASNPLEPVVTAQPNPTTGKSWVAIPVELDDPATLRVCDPQGRAVRNYRLAQGQRLLELDLSGLANGLYTCELLQGEFKLGVVKVTVQR